MKKQYLEPKMRVMKIEDGNHFLCASQVDGGAKLDGITNHDEGDGFSDPSSSSNSKIWQYYEND